MAVNNVLLFGFSAHSAAEILWGTHPFHWLVLALFGVLPVLGLWNRLDPVFSHGHMAGRHCFGALMMTRRLYVKLPLELRKVCSLQGRFYLLDIGKWGFCAL